MLISFGGTDRHDVTLRVLQMIAPMKLSKEISFSIVIGPFYRFEKSLIEALKTFPYRFELFKEITSIDECLCGVDKAIIFHGVSFYELYNKEIPTFSIATEEQYIQEMQNIELSGYGINGGNFDKIDEDKLKAFLESENLAIDFSQKADMETLYNHIIAEV